jgi:hypothetical protein
VDIGDVLYSKVGVYSWCWCMYNETCYLHWYCRCNYVFSLRLDFIRGGTDQGRGKAEKGWIICRSSKAKEGKEGSASCRKSKRTGCSKRPTRIYKDRHSRRRNYKGTLLE